METTADKTSVEDPPIFSEDVTEVDPIVAVFDEAELMFELGIWLSSLESFLRMGEHGFAAPQAASAPPRDYMREFRLTHAALMLCSRLNFRLRRTSAGGSAKQKFAVSTRLSEAEMTAFGLMLRNAILLNEGIIKTGPLGFGEWNAWKVDLADKLAASPEVKALIGFAEKGGESYLPSEMMELLQTKKLSFSDQAELNVILPRFARILKWLSVVGRMLRDDEPLKLSLLIFSRVHEQTTDLISYIDKRLARFPDETAELFGSLDGASYTASLELKKVYNQELIGLVGVRPAPSVYARVETAYSLLNDSFQQILTGFARLADPQVSMLELFPGFRVKLDQSLMLRDHLAKVRRSVQAAEQSPDRSLLEALKKELNDLLENTMQFLFYKDRETIERFGEEVMAAGDKKDLVPILHRFGAYLETLFGQVNMRTVLADHPFGE
ncbi:MAG TPA: hypothetical protein VK468_02220 [Pyrinomonadaceae bacterium]|nr:hypothetical protein [Pyrinomonadaceae bacterium]